MTANSESHRAAFEAWYLPIYNSGIVPTPFEAWIAAKSEPLAVTEKRTIEVAKLLMAMDEGCKVSDWQPGLDNIFAATVHGGDCTKECHTCPVCQADAYKDRVRQIVAALNHGGE